QPRATGLCSPRRDRTVTPCLRATVRSSKSKESMKSARRIDRKTIAYVAPGFPPRLGGVETQVAELAVRAARAGWMVEVLCQDGERRASVETLDGVTVRRFP